MFLAMAAWLMAGTEGRASTGMASQTLSAWLYPTAKLSVPAATTMSPGAGRFRSFSAVMPVTYRARTTAGGGGSITLQVTGDFSPAGGPSVSGGALQYSCSEASLGTACAGLQTAAVGYQTPVLTVPAAACTGGGGACSAADSNSLRLNFTLADDPGYATGSYSAQLTFIISAT
ncbi:MAG: hypothetical protein LAP40_26330 [Acidobacteriia bacterium]|nr:hypothetical protein [Terriglobia bacterium]